MRWRWRAFAAYAALFAIVLWRWQAIEPSNDRDWQPEIARLAYATIDGDRVTVHNIRNFDYRTRDRLHAGVLRQDLRPAQARLGRPGGVLLDGAGDRAHLPQLRLRRSEHLAISIEARKERGEGYSSVQGFFRQYELYYVVADERDVIRVRTNYRRDPPEEVYLYRLRGTREATRAACSSTTSRRSTA